MSGFNVDISGIISGAITPVKNAVSGAASIIDRAKAAASGASGALGQVTTALEKNSLVSFAKGFAEAPTNALSSAAKKLGFDDAAKAIKTGRIDDIVSAAGKDAVELLTAEGTRQINKAIDGMLGGLGELIGSLDSSDHPPAGDVLLVLGPFQFMVGTMAHQSIKRTSEYRWPNQDRITRAPAHQFVGIGIDRIELEGYLLPHYTGSTSHIQTLRRMAEAGEPYELVDHYGSAYGRYVVLRVEETRTELDRVGQPRRVDFRLELAAYGEDDVVATTNGSSQKTASSDQQPEEMTA